MSQINGYYSILYVRTRFTSKRLVIGVKAVKWVYYGR